MAAVALLAGGSWPAGAQVIGDASPEVTPAQADEDEGLADLVVTASRRRERAIDVPVAVSVLSGERLNVANSSGLDIRFLSARTPSLLVESSFGRTFPRFYIRGLGNTDFDPNAAQPVSVVYDDVALENPMLKSFPVFDLASVQVLRGPQGTLFGRNTPAGVVKLDSARPTAEFTGHGSASLASYNSVNLETGVGGPIAEGLSFRVSGLLQRRDDWVDNSFTGGLADRELEGYRDMAGRAQLDFRSGGFHALANLHGRDLNGTPRIFRAGIIERGSNRFVPAFDKDVVSIDGNTSQTLEQWGANLHLDYGFEGIGTLYSVTAWEEAEVESTGDIDGGSCYSFIPGCNLGDIHIGLFPSNTGGLTKPKEFSQELRFASEEFGGLRLQGGVYYLDQDLRYTELSYAGTTTSTQNIVHDNDGQNIGVFASGEFRAAEQLTLRAGVRYSHDERTDRLSGFSPDLSPGVTLPTELSVEGDNVSWDASATYAVSPELSLYARFATGYLGPAIQDRITFGSQQTAAAEQTTISAEAGLKSWFLERSVRVDVAGYWWRTKDLQLTAVGGATNSARLLNADKAVGYGIEAEVEARPVPELTLSGGFSYNFTEVRDPGIAVAPCGSGLCTVRDPLTAGGLAIIDGNDLPQAPRVVANWTARYGLPLANDGELFAFTDWAYRSRINYFLYEAAEFRGRPYLEGGLRLGYRAPSGVEAAVFARNILNQIRIVSAIDFNNLTGMINEPRIIGAELRFSF